MCSSPVAAMTEHHKLGPKTTEMDCLTVPEARSLKSRGLQGRAALTRVEEFLLVSSRFSGSRDSLWLVAAQLQSLPSLSHGLLHAVSASTWPSQEDQSYWSRTHPTPVSPQLN